MRTAIAAGFCQSNPAGNLQHFLGRVANVRFEHRLPAGAFQRQALNGDLRIHASLAGIDRVAGRVGNRRIDPSFEFNLVHLKVASLAGAEADQQRFRGQQAGRHFRFGVLNAIGRRERLPRLPVAAHLGGARAADVVVYIESNMAGPEGVPWQGKAIDYPAAVAERPSVAVESDGALLEHAMVVAPRARMCRGTDTFRRESILPRPAPRVRPRGYGRPAQGRWRPSRTGWSPSRAIAPALGSPGPLRARKTWPYDFHSGPTSW